MQEEIIRLAEDMISGTEEEYWYRRLQECLKCENQIQKKKIVEQICQICVFNFGGSEMFALGVLIYENEAFKKIIDENTNLISGEGMAVRFIQDGYSIFHNQIYEYCWAFKELEQAGIKYGLNVSYLANRFLRMFRGKYQRLWIRYLPVALDGFRYCCYMDDRDIKFITNTVYYESTPLSSTSGIVLTFPLVKVKQNE